VKVNRTIFAYFFPALLLISLIFISACDEDNPFGPAQPVDKFFVGTILNSQGEPLSNVLVSIFMAGSIGNLPPLTTTVSDTSGDWNVTIQITQTQSFDIVFSRTGYFDVISQTALSFLSDTTYVGVIAVPEFDFNGEYRIVLTWNDTPKDLDAHLTGADGSGGRFHVYWNNRTASTGDTALISKLDIDQKSGFGPETMTIHQMIPGIFRYTVHNYSANERSENLDLYRSGATVRVFSRSGMIHEYKINGETERQDSVGNAWRVFELIGETGEFVKIDQVLDNVAFDNSSLFKGIKRVKN
jgi:hypothetical protein